MKAGRALLMTLAAVSLCAAAPDGEQDRVRWQGKMRHIAVFAPHTAPAGSPLLIVAGEAGRSARYALDSWREVAALEGFVVAAISPESVEAWRVPVDGPGYLRAVVQHMKTRHRIDPRRVYLFGAGSGGAFVLSMGALQPSYFAAVASFGGQPRLNALRENPLARPLPVRIYFAKRMPQFDVDVLREAAAVLREMGAEVELRRLDTPPNFERKGARKAARIWAELGSHALSDPPAYSVTAFDR